MAVFSLGWTEGRKTEGRTGKATSTISRALGEQNPARQRAAVRRAVAALDEPVAVYDSSGRILAQSGDAPSSLTGPKVQAEARSLRHGATPRRNGIDLTALAVGGRAYLVASKPQAPVLPPGVVLRGLGVVLGGAGAAGGVFLALALGRLLAPLIRERFRRRERKAAAVAALDPLTGLLDRTGLRAEGESMILRRRNDGQVTLLLLDLDEFKEVNDTLGHFSGDQLLRSVGDRLRSVVERDGTLGRLGGDEFALVMAGDEADAREIADQIAVALRRPFVIHGLMIQLEASIGIAVCPQHGLDYETLLQRADAAMYQAKRQRSGYEMHSERVAAAQASKLALAADLRRGISDGQLFLEYQPKALLRTGDVHGVEALVRWNHPERGTIPPDRFIPLAERSGLIRDLSLWVLHAAAEQAAAWKRNGLDLSIAVNLSARDLIDSDLPRRIDEAITAHGIEPATFEIEITESVLMADPQRAQSVVAAIRELGVSTTIDDFGSGYSSLAYLRRLPVAALKIDRAFVSAMTSEQRDEMIVRSIVDLAHNLGLQVVAEGAEDMSTWVRLQALGCDSIQGFVLSRPQLPVDLAPWLQARLRPAA
jgi:diguanylate cyclase (GGDEF)-like protein